MNRNDLTLPAAMLALLCLPVTATSQSTDELPPELLACAEESDVARRLACFDREMAKLSDVPEPEAPPAPAPEPAAAEVAPEPAPEPVPEPAAESAPAAAAVPEKNMAAPRSAAVSAPAVATTATAATVAESAPSPSPAPIAEAAPEPEPAEDFGLADDERKQITAKVRNIMERPRGELVILLDNGQIWEQKHQDNRFQLSIGDDVTIDEGLISGYRLTGGGRNNSIQVERLK